MQKSLQTQSIYYTNILGTSYFVACAIILLIELACSFAVSTSESYSSKSMMQSENLEKLTAKGKGKGN